MTGVQTCALPISAARRCTEYGSDSPHPRASWGLVLGGGALHAPAQLPCPGSRVPGHRRSKDTPTTRPLCIPRPDRRPAVSRMPISTSRLPRLSASAVRRSGLSPERFTGAYTGLLCSEGGPDSLPPTGPLQTPLLGTMAPVALCGRALLLLPERCGGSMRFLRGRPPPQAAVPCLEREGRPERR